MARKPGKILTIASAVALFLGVSFLALWFFGVDTSPMWIGSGQYMEPLINEEEFQQGVIAGAVWCLFSGIGLFLGIRRLSQ